MSCFRCMYRYYFWVCRKSVIYISDHDIYIIEQTCIAEFFSTSHFLFNNVVTLNSTMHCNIAQGNKINFLLLQKLF